MEWFLGWTQPQMYMRKRKEAVAHCPHHQSPKQRSDGLDPRSQQSPNPRACFTPLGSASHRFNKWEVSLVLGAAITCVVLRVSGTLWSSHHYPSWQVKKLRLRRLRPHSLTCRKVKGYKPRVGLSHCPSSKAITWKSLQNPKLKLGAFPRVIQSQHDFFLIIKKK